jgi:hypothetical protein
MDDKPFSRIITAWHEVARVDEVIQASDEAAPTAKFRISVHQNLPEWPASSRDSLVVGQRLWQRHEFLINEHVRSDQDVTLAIKRVAAEIGCSAFLARECIRKLPPREHPPSTYRKLDRYQNFKLRLNARDHVPQGVEQLAKVVFKVVTDSATADALYSFLYEVQMQLEPAREAYRKGEAPPHSEEELELDRAIAESTPRPPEPRGRQDIARERYFYKGCEIKIYQDAKSLGAEHPTYFAMTALPYGKTGKKFRRAVVEQDPHPDSIEEVKRAAEAYIDERV